MNVARWLAAVATVAAAQVATLAHADSTAAPRLQGVNDQYIGALGTMIPIDVPRYHGIEPHLSLSYNSSGGNGFLGMGWSLPALSVIERATSGRGAPRYDGSDVFYVDGQLLVACATGSVSPSCTTGGNYSTEIESYQRIVADPSFAGGNATNYTDNPAGPKWTITGKDGTKRVYYPIFETLIGTSWYTYKWGLYQVIDTHGNTVTYNWNVNLFASSWAYPQNVTYNGTTITFYWDQRTDLDGHPTGYGLDTPQGRIKTIDVQTSGSRVRSYKLAYAASGSTGRSLLTSVQEFGKDGTVDATGTVTGGTALPAATLGWQTPASTGFTSVLPAVNDWGFADDRRRFVDWNGDGMTDFCRAVGGTNALNQQGTSLQCDLSTGSGFNTVFIGISDWGYDDSRRAFIDWNGDGKMDYCRAVGTGSTFACALSTGTGFSDIGMAMDDWGYDDSRRKFVDWNGDGKTDYCRAVGNNNALNQSGNTLRCDLSTGGAGFTTVNMPMDDWGFDDSRRVYIDWNGDGKTDYCRAVGTGGTFRCDLSKGAAGFTTVLMGMDDWGYDDSRRAFVDWNGDGKTDYCRATGNNNALNQSGNTLRCDLSNGLTGFQTVNIAMSDWGFTDSRRAYIDWNGDGKADYCRAVGDPGGTSLRCDLSTGTGFNTVFIGVNNDWGYDDSRRAFVDWNGDGNRDYCRAVGNTNALNQSGTNLRCDLAAPSGAPDLVTSFANGNGGTTTVGYTSSSAWSNTNNPPIVQTVTSIATNDGRGNASTITYAYSGGLYDRVNRRFLGFAYTKETSPALAGEAAAPYAETWFAQDYGSVSKQKEIRYSTGAGVVLTDRQFVFATNGSTVPYQSLVTGKWSYTYDGSGTACAAWPCAHGKRTYVSTAYDNYNGTTWSAGYGNSVVVYMYGDNDASGDETTTATQYYPNAAAYIVGAPATVSTYAGLSTSGTLLGQVLNYYDGATVATTPPVVGNLTQNQKWLNQPTSAFITTSATFDAYGNATTTIDTLGKATTTAYDATYHVYPLTVTNALNQVSTTAYDTVLGVPTAMTDLDGKTTTTAYDALARPVTVTDALGNVTTTVYCALSSTTNQCGVASGNNAQYTETQSPAADGSGYLWARTYPDGLGRAYQTVRKGPGASSGAPYSSTQNIFTVSTFDARNNLSTTSLPGYGAASASVTTRKYDALNRPVQTILSDGTKVTTSYTMGACNVPAAGATCAMTVVTDQLGHQSVDTTDAFERRIVHQESHGTGWVTKTETLNLLGQLVSTTDPNGNVVSYTIDSLGRVIQQVDPDMGTWTFAFNPKGQETSHTDALGQQTVTTYDALGRRTGRTLRAGTVNAATDSWTYDEARTGYCNIGRMTSQAGNAGSVTLNYDANGRLVDAIKYGYEFKYTYDGGDRLLGTLYPDGEVVGKNPVTGAGTPLGYDSAGRLTSIPNAAGATPTMIVSSIVYDAMDRSAQRTNGNGTTTTRTYDPNRAWMTALKTTAGTTTLQDLTYTRDVEGHITTLAANTTTVPNEVNAGWTFTYDDMHRLVTATNVSNAAYSQSFQYDNIGNMTSGPLGAYTYGAKPHAVTTAGTITYTYDANGSMLSGAGRTFVYDGANRATTIGSNTMVYGPDDTRVSRKNSTGVVTTYVGDDYELSPTGVSTKYINGLAKRTGGATYWIHSDHQGSIQVETDASGVEVNRAKYFAFGDQLSTSGTVLESKGYIGERRDDTGLVYLHARYYDPKLSRFTAADPTTPHTDVVGANRYAYSSNNPVDRVDPNGLSDYITSDPSPSGYVPYSQTPSGVAQITCIGCTAGDTRARPLIIMGSGETADPGHLAINPPPGGAYYVDSAASGNWVRAFASYGSNAAISTAADRIDHALQQTDANGNKLYNVSVEVSHSAGIQTLRDLVDMQGGDIPALATGTPSAREGNDSHWEDGNRIYDYNLSGDTIAHGVVGYLGNQTVHDTGYQDLFSTSFYSSWSAQAGVSSTSTSDGDGSSGGDSYNGCPGCDNYGGGDQWGYADTSGGGDSSGGDGSSSGFVDYGGGDQWGYADSSSSGDSSGGGGGCFRAGTPITMADGSKKNIEDIAVGDDVLAYDEEAHEVVHAEVDRVVSHPHDGWLLINGAVEATPEHPFFVNGRFVRADEMTVGDELSQAPAARACSASTPNASSPSSGMNAMKVESIEWHAGTTKVYNFTVRGVHTYFAGGYLVHNIVTCF